MEPVVEDEELLTTPPGAGKKMRRAAMKVRGPVEAFLHLETSGGIVLLFAAAIALIWANSAWSDSYHHLWHTPISLSAAGHELSFNLHFLINDGLMTIFFLVVGLEIKRELVDGELSDMKRAALPVAAAVGGMLVPALIYFSLNTEGPTRSGWGVPMATDIAFAVGILSLLGKRVPASMRILLLALAIIDDLGAILVIALFYSSGISVEGLAICAAGVAILILWLRLGVRPGPLYLVPLIVLWIGLLFAGVHPTLSGVIVGLCTPVRPWLGEHQFIAVAERAIDDFHKVADTPNHDNHELVAPVRRLVFAAREALSPVVRGAAEMHPWVAFGIMPIFALANAGVSLGGVDFSTDASVTVILGVAIGLAVGKPIGVFLLSWIFVRLKLASLPRGLGWGGVVVVGMSAGIGFTMAIFIAELAFKGQPELLSAAKLAILIATSIAAIGCMIVGAISLKPVAPEIAKLSPSDVERSTEY